MGGGWRFSSPSPPCVAPTHIVTERELRRIQRAVLGLLSTTTGSPHKRTTQVPPACWLVKRERLQEERDRTLKPSWRMLERDDNHNMVVIGFAITCQGPTPIDTLPQLPCAQQCHTCGVDGPSSFDCWRVVQNPQAHQLQLAPERSPEPCGTQQLLLPPVRTLVIHGQKHCLSRCLRH